MSNSKTTDNWFEMINKVTNRLKSAAANRDVSEELLDIGLFLNFHLNMMNELLDETVRNPDWQRHISK